MIWLIILLGTLFAGQYYSEGMAAAAYERREDKRKEEEWKAQEIQISKDIRRRARISFARKIPLYDLRELQREKEGTESGDLLYEIRKERVMENRRSRLRSFGLRKRVNEKLEAVDIRSYSDD